MKLLKTIKETFLSSLPLAVIVIIFLAISPLNSAYEYMQISIGYIFVVIGQSLFLVGLESSILPIGHMVGSTFSKYKNLFFILLFGFMFGLLATIAEPALSVLANQIGIVLPSINKTLFIWITGTGIGLGVAIALVSIVKNLNIKIVFAVLYIIAFALVVFAPPEFVSLAFDTSGATTGDVSVPFILALGTGISATFSKRKTNEDSFGIIAISSVGPIITVLIYGIVLKLTNGGLLQHIADINMQEVSSFGIIILNNILNITLAILPIVLFSVPFLIFKIKLSRKQFFKLMLGIVPVFIGLLIFLTGIDYGFTFVGEYIGKIFFNTNSPNGIYWLLIIVGFVLGISITFSEPAVTVLGSQIEEITNGHIKKKTIIIALAFGIGIASSLAILKILTQVNILYFLVPLYTISLILMIFTPKLFVAIAFDAGGVTGGALTSAFLTPLCLSIAKEVALMTGSNVSVLTNGFGIIAFISVTPLIAIQILGIIYNSKLKKAERLMQEESFDEFFVSPKNKRKKLKKKER